MTYNFPPLVGVGSMRVHMLAKGLAHAGYRVSVITVLDPPGGEVDERSLSELEGLINIHRAQTKEPMYYVHKLRHALGSKQTQEEVSPKQSLPRSQRLKVPSQLKRLVQSFYIPDEKISWAYEAYKLGCSLHTEDPFDLVISSGPPHSAHVCAMRLAKTINTPYLLDLRDPWYSNTLHNSKGANKKQLELEQEAFSEARALVSLTPGLLEDVSSRYPEFKDKLFFIPNAAQDNKRAYEKDSSRLNICYTGNLQGTQNLDRIYKALEAIDEEGKFDLSELHFIVVGNIEESFKPHSDALKSLFSFVGPKSADEVRAYQAKSDALLYIHGLEKQYQLVLGAKFAEYLRASRPIIGLCQKGSDAARELKRLGQNYLAQPYSVPEIKFLLEHIIKNQDELRNFSYTLKQGRYITSKYSEQAFIESYVQLIEALMR